MDCPAVSIHPQIVSLERKLVELQQTSCVSLEEERERAEMKMANLRYKYYIASWFVLV